MNHSPVTFAVVISGLIAVAGLGSGCQVPRALRSTESKLFPWKNQTDREPYTFEDRHDSETYVPESDEETPRLRLPPEPAVVPPSGPSLRSVPNTNPMPAPPAVENETPQARRWFPTRPGLAAPRVPQVSRETISESDSEGLPPARVTYESQELDDEPTTDANPEQSSNTQPRLFRPASSAKNLFDSMKRKLGRSETQ